VINPKEDHHILLIGAAGGLAQLTTHLILNKYPNWRIIAVDTRRPPKEYSNFDNIDYLQMKYSRGNFEKLFRNYHFDTVLHLGRVTHASEEQVNIIRRLNLNLMGTNRILDLSLQKKVSTVLVLSTYHVYGAMPDNPIFLTEDSPLRASITYPQLRDVVEMDQICTNWMWRHQNQVRTLVLRPCNIVGNKIRNAISRFLSSDFAFKPIDFNPYFQFIHEFDMAQTILYSLEKVPTGVYNVAPNDYVSLRDAVNIIQDSPPPFPMFMAKPLNRVMKKMGFQGTPDYLIDYLTYSCLIDNSQLKKHLPEDFFRFDVNQTLRLLKL
jgi:UDP-glucose 4-epimerase